MVMLLWFMDRLRQMDKAKTLFHKLPDSWRIGFWMSATVLEE
jgi:hypothetical protein